MSTSSGSAQAGPTADELLQNLLDSVTPTSSDASGDGASAAATTTAPAATTTAASTPAPSSADQTTKSTADTKATSGSSSGGSAGLSIGLGVGAVLLVAFVVLYFRQRKKRRYKAPGHNHDLGTPQLSIELPRPPHLDPHGGRKPQGGEQRVSVFTSVQHGGEFNAAAEEASPAFQGNARPAPSVQYPQSGPVSTTFRMEGGSAAFNPSVVNPVPDSSKTAKTTRVMAGRVPAFDNPRPAAAAPPPLTEGGGSLPRDTNMSTSSLNSLHDSTCGDFFKHGDGLGERLRAKSRAKHPSMVLEEDEESTAAFVKAPTIATSDAQMYRPSTGSEIQFQRLSTMSSDSIGSMKRASMASTDSSNPRAGSMIEINEIIGGDGSERAKEIEI